MARNYDLSYPVAYAIAGAYSPTLVATHVSNLIQARINDVDTGIEITMNSDAASLFTVQGEVSEGTGPREIVLEVFQAESLGITKKIRFSQIATIARAESSGRYTITGLTDDVVNYPVSVYDTRYPAQQEALEVLRNNKDLEGKDIRTYEFQKFKQFPKTYWLEGWPWDPGKDYTPQEQVRVILNRGM